MSAITAPGCHSAMTRLGSWNACLKYPPPGTLFGIVSHRRRFLAPFSVGHGLMEKSFAWIASSRIHSPPVSPGLPDSMPPFSMLTSDEERERKAESSSPGTYHVIVNPDSFSGLPEYADESADDLNISSLSLGRGSETSSRIGNSRRGERESSIETGDPNVVILSRFEDSTHRSPSSQWKKSRLSPASDITAASSQAIPAQFPVDEKGPRPLDRMVSQGGQDERLLSHFRDVVWRQLIQGQSTRDSSPISSPIFPNVYIFEEVASTFRPVSLPCLSL